MNERSHSERTKLGRSVVALAFVVGCMIALAALAPSVRAPLTSSEIDFFDASARGLGILPASCASSPMYYHYHAFVAPGNTRAFVSNTGETEYGATLTGAGTYVCITNATGLNYFVPANTAAEINAFKAKVIPGMSKW